MVKHQRRITELAAEGKFLGLMRTGFGTGKEKSTGPTSAAAETRKRACIWENFESCKALGGVTGVR